MLKNKSVFADLPKKKLERLFVQRLGNQLRWVEWNACMILHSKVLGTRDFMRESK